MAGVEIESGLLFSSPSVFIPWEYSPINLRDVWGNSLKVVTESYLCGDCKIFDGLSCMIGFHFDDHERLNHFEFFRRYKTTSVNTYELNLRKSYNEFQSYFEKGFGRPHTSKAGNEGFMSHEWFFNDVSISHCVFDRFGLEERLGIRKVWK